MSCAHVVSSVLFQRLFILRPGVLLLLCSAAGNVSSMLWRCEDGGREARYAAMLAICVAM